ncbi:uncharacterized protein BDZ83DRAFT_645417 [Colletotrichum acutatum]|uniref:Secreted protein n=1 Tax=Glomerella acutata TaxID=27357 RepID=A0AAD8U8R2_GLOAC|nr:uncharacterized protein BDZ83DRAFT_645417 [Colletotrichum acutatum]KAK1702149.1 hypothetical protein BDZ83DRAFT_645417 [Colletotrichum acutatum]
MMTLGLSLVTVGFVVRFIGVAAEVALHDDSKGCTFDTFMAISGFVTSSHNRSSVSMSTVSSTETTSRMMSNRNKTLDSLAKVSGETAKGPVECGSCIASPKTSPPFTAPPRTVAHRATGSSLSAARRLMAPLQI